MNKWFNLMVSVGLVKRSPTYEAVKLQLADLMVNVGLVQRSPTYAVTELLPAVADIFFSPARHHIQSVRHCRLTRDGRAL